ncbi:MAG: signal peptidase II [Bacilli bacterium]|nr:signal peptidase II [Bacilli bacterium]
MEKVLKFLKKYYLCFIIVFLAFSLDLLTKFIATKKLLEIVGDNTYFKSVEVINNFFYFTYTRNTGGGWSIFAGQMWLFIIITVFALVAFVYFLSDFDLKKRPLYSIGFALMLGGTLGNFYERIVNGYVTDFFDFIIFGYDYPIFNVADICLVCGVIILIVQLIFWPNQVTIFDKYKKNKPLEEKEEKDVNETSNEDQQ